MIIVLRHGTSQQVDEIVERLKKLGFGAHISKEPKEPLLVHW